MKIELSDANFSQDANLNDWITNKERVAFPGVNEEQLEDSDSEFEDET